MRIAHLSDLHMLSLAGVPMRRFLNKRLTGYANLRLRRDKIHRPSYVRAVAREIRRQAVDHVVISGDLTNLALESEFELARDVIERELGLGPHDVSIVPGNHDLYTRGSHLSRRFATYFAPYLVSDLPDLVVDVGVGPFPFVKLRGPAAIIGLSSAVPRLPLVASGKLGRHQLEALTAILAHPEVRTRTPIVVLHHPAHNPRSRLKTLLGGLEDAALLWTSLQHLPVGMIVHGHLHRRIQRIMPTATGRITSVGATSASLHHEAEAKMAGFNVYEIDDRGDISVVEAHVYVPESEAFAVREVPLG